MAIKLRQIWVAAFLFFVPVEAQATAAGLFATETSSGFALYGFDPVSYFTGDGPRVGNTKFEAEWGRTYWRFANSGNQQAFIAHPQSYAPQFAGCDPMLLADGAATMGRPLVFARVSEQLYLFHSAVNRLRFLQGLPGTLDMARRNAKRLGCSFLHVSLPVTAYQD